MREIRAEMKKAGIRGYSKMNQQQLYEYAEQSGIDISRQVESL
jgi:L-rhamnose mutarotase